MTTTDDSDDCYIVEDEGLFDCSETSSDVN